MLNFGLAAAAAAAMIQSQTITYSYDAVGRVRTAAYPSGEVETYVYDRAGNRTSQTVAAAALQAGVVPPEDAAAEADQADPNDEPITPSEPQV